MNITLNQLSQPLRKRILAEINDPSLRIKEAFQSIEKLFIYFNSEDYIHLLTLDEGGADSLPLIKHKRSMETEYIVDDSYEDNLLKSFPRLQNKKTLYIYLEFDRRARDYKVVIPLSDINQLLNNEISGYGNVIIFLENGVEEFMDNLNNLPEDEKESVVNILIDLSQYLNKLRQHYKETY